MLTRDKLLAKVTLLSEVVHLPEMGGDVLVRGMTAAELLSFQAAVSTGKKNGTTVAVDEKSFPSKLLVRCIVDEKGKRILNDDDWQVLEAWPAAAFQRAASVALRVNGYESAEGN